jgi:NTP pyrophosphatase (non-canonical NTP hydrolase)
MAEFLYPVNTWVKEENGKRIGKVETIKGTEQGVYYSLREYPGIFFHENELTDALSNAEADELQKILEANDSAYNYLKLAEECSELAEVLIKRVTKSSEDAPSDEKIIEELGDVLLRAMFIVEKSEREIEKRLEQKALALLNYARKNPDSNRV